MYLQGQVRTSDLLSGRYQFDLSGEERYILLRYTHDALDHAV
jgi:hypothetical protein